MYEIPQRDLGLTSSQESMPGSAREGVWVQNGARSCFFLPGSPPLRNSRPMLPAAAEIAVCLLLGLGLLMLLTLANPAAALSPDKAIHQYVHKSWSNPDGLPQNTVTSIVQTGDGYLWFGTLEGLVRFDGVRFALFNTRTVATFDHNFVVSLTVDTSDRLWIATSGGGLLRMQNETFTRFGRDQGLPSEQVSIVHEDRHGRLWVGTDGGGLAWLKGEKFIVDEVYAELGGHIRSLVDDDRGLWVGTERGLFLLPADAPGAAGMTVQNRYGAGVRALLFDNTGSLWVGGDQGLVLMTDDTTVDPLVGQRLPEDMISSLLEDRNGNLWIGTDGGGLWRWSNGQLVGFTEDQGLTDNAILSLFEGAEGGLWIGTNMGGLNHLADGAITTFTTRDALPGDIVRAVFQDGSGSLWVGFEGAGVVEWRDDRAASAGLQGRTVYAMEQDDRGQLWFGTDKGLARYQQGRFTGTDTFPDLHGVPVLSLRKDRRGHLWVGTYAAGLYRLSEQRLERFSAESGLLHDTINTLYEDSAGILWVGTRGGGLYRYENGRFLAITTAGGLSDDLVFAIHEDQQRNLWIGTYGGGLNRLRNGRAARIGEDQGLFDNLIHTIVEDADGYLWMSSNRGISRVSRQELDAVAEGKEQRVHTSVFGVADGMGNAECNGGANAGLMDRNGYLWFPSMGGLVRLDPVQALEDRSLSAPVLVEEFRVDGVALAPGQPLNLPAGTGNLEVHYTAPVLTKPEILQFRYRLKGFEREWVDAGSRRTAYYSQLPAGDYRFEVQARMENGDWLPASTTASVYIAPFFHETWWFRVLIALGCILLVIAAHQLRLRRLTSRTLELEDTVARRTAELREANRRLARLAHEDTLTGLRNRRAFDAALREECRRAERSGTPLALLLLDIDYFKQYNDHFGHQQGDDCIREIAQALLQACNRAGETVARYGGEELAVILPGCAAADAQVQAENLRRCVLKLALPHPDSPAGDCVSISIGVACSSGAEATEPARLLGAADRALYLAKDRGRNRVEYEPGRTPGMAGVPA